MKGIKLCIKKVLLFCISIIFSISYIGCWNRRELSTVAIIQGVGIDKSSDIDIKLTTQIIRPESMKKTQGSKEKHVVTIKSTGESSFDAFRNSTFISDRKLFLSHNKVIVIGEDLAKQGVSSVLDFFARDHEGSGNVLLFISKEKAEDIIEGHHDQETILAKAIENLAKTTIVSGKVVKETMDDFFKQYSGDIPYAIIPGVKVGENGSINLDETAVFKSDKLVGWLDHKETRGLLWTLGKVKSTIVLINTPQEENKKVSLEVLSEKMERSLTIVDGKPVVNLKINVKSSLGEQVSDKNLIHKEYIEDMEKRQSVVIKEEIENIINKSKRELNVDIFGFGAMIHKRKPKMWAVLKDNWDDEFKNLKVNIEVKSKIVRVGLKLDTKGGR